MSPSFLTPSDLADLKAAMAPFQKKAFVPGPSVQGQLQRLQALAAEGGDDQQAAAMAAQNAQAQGQGAPPMMRIEDLAQMINDGFSQLAQMIQQVAAPPPPVAAPAPAPAAAPAAPAGGEGGGEKKPKKEDMIVAALGRIEQLLAGATGGAPPGGAGLPIPPTPPADPNAPQDPNAQQPPAPAQAAPPTM